VSVRGSKLAKKPVATPVTEPARNGRMFTAAERGVRVRSAIDQLRSKGISIVKVEGVRGQWTGDTGGDATAALWLETERGKGTAIKLIGSKFSIDLQLVKPVPTEAKATPQSAATVKTKKTKK
jgi:hypothetical protein